MASKHKHAPAEAAQARPSHEKLGFWLGLRLSPSLSPRAEIEFLRSLEDQILDRGMRFGGGTQLRLFIEADDRDLALADQVDLIDWCLLRGMAGDLAVSSLTPARTLIPVTRKVLRISRWDMATIGVGLLYRIGRLKPEQYVELLGGFQANTSGELFA